MPHPGQPPTAGAGYNPERSGPVPGSICPWHVVARVPVVVGELLAGSEAVEVMEHGGPILDARAMRRRGVPAAVLAVAALLLLAVAAVAMGGFDDDEGSVHEPAIDALAAEGILEGTECGERLICPGEPFERWMMAVWLVRVLGESPAASSVRFTDVDPDSWWAPYVERLAELRITLGCATGPARYCPDDPVSRAQMATFLVRAFDFEPAQVAGFADTAGSSHAGNIDALAAAGITAGCATEPARYCPNDPVTRGQMATFVARALGLVSLPTEVGARPYVPFTAVATSSFASCGLRADGTVDCWGWPYLRRPGPRPRLAADGGRRPTLRSVHRSSDKLVCVLWAAGGRDGGLLGIEFIWRRRGTGGPVHRGHSSSVCVRDTRRRHGGVLG